jgi:hypothetical protein
MDRRRSEQKGQFRRGGTAAQQHSYMTKTFVCSGAGAFAILT